MRRHVLLAAAIGLSIAVLTSCAQPSEDPEIAPTTQGDSASATPRDAPEAAGEQQFPDVLKAELNPSGDGFTIAVTISSPYDSTNRYADGWRVLTPGGEVLAVHELGHDHASEQPFTRTSGPFAIPDDVSEVEVEGRDQANGYGGETVTVTVPR